MLRKNSPRSVIRSRSGAADWRKARRFCNGSGPKRMSRITADIINSTTCTSEAIRSAGDSFIAAFERMYFRWPHPVVKRPAGQLTIERLAENRIILGDPKTCIEEILRFQRELSASHLVCGFSVPGISRQACERSLELFTREVMPALRSSTP